MRFIWDAAFYTWIFESLAGDCSTAYCHIGTMQILETPRISCFTSAYATSTRPKPNDSRVNEPIRWASSVCSHLKAIRSYSRTTFTYSRVGAQNRKVHQLHLLWLWNKTAISNDSSGDVYGTEYAQPA